MTSRERLVAMARGGDVDRKPMVALPGVSDERADAVCGSADDYHAGDQAYLVVVDGLLKTARSQEPDIYAKLDEDPEGGAKLLNGFAESVRAACESGLATGADGVFYVIEGANPADSTPMQYGGHILEMDRMLLDGIKDARFNVAFVTDESEPYMDFLSDLPCHALGWKKASGVSLESVRLMRTGALAMDSVDADVILISEAMQKELPDLMEAQA